MNEYKLFSPRIPEFEKSVSFIEKIFLNNDEIIKKNKNKSLSSNNIFHKKKIDYNNNYNNYNNLNNKPYFISENEKNVNNYKNKFNDINFKINKRNENYLNYMYKNDILPIIHNKYKSNDLNNNFDINMNNSNINYYKLRNNNVINIKPFNSQNSTPYYSNKI